MCGDHGDLGERVGSAYVEHVCFVVVFIYIYNYIYNPKHAASVYIIYIQVRHQFSLTYLNIRHSSLIFAYIQFYINIRYIR